MRSPRVAETVVGLAVVVAIATAADDRGQVMVVALHPHELPALGSTTFQLFHRVGAQWELA